MSRNPFRELENLPKWKVKKLSSADIAYYQLTLRIAVDDLQERLGWVNRWQNLLEDEMGARRGAAAELERRRQKDLDQARRLEERNAALEQQWLSDQYAE